MSVTFIHAGGKQSASIAIRKIPAQKEATEEKAPLHYDPFEVFEQNQQPPTDATDDRPASEDESAICDDAGSEGELSDIAEETEEDRQRRSYDRIQSHCMLGGTPRENELLDQFFALEKKLASWLGKSPSFDEPRRCDDVLSLAESCAEEALDIASALMRHWARNGVTLIVPESKRVGRHETLKTLRQIPRNSGLFWFDDSVAGIPSDFRRYAEHIERHGHQIARYAEDDDRLQIEIAFAMLRRKAERIASRVEIAWGDVLDIYFHETVIDPLNGALHKSREIANDIDDGSPENGRTLTS